MDFEIRTAVSAGIGNGTRRCSIALAHWKTATPFYWIDTRCAATRLARCGLEACAIGTGFDVAPSCVRDAGKHYSSKANDEYGTSSEVR